MEDDNSLHLMMTGVGDFSISSKDSPNEASVLFEAMRKNAGGGWSVVYTMDYSQTMNYDDLAKTEKNIVVAGRYDAGDGKGRHTLLSYNWVGALASVSCIINYAAGGLPMHTHTIYPTLPSVFYTYNYLNSTSYDYMEIVSMESGDGVATVCDGITLQFGAPDTMRHIISVYSDPAAAPISRFGFDDGFYGDYQSFAYNKKQGSLFVITKDLTKIYRSTYPFNNIFEGKVTSFPLNLFSVTPVPLSSFNLVSGSEPPTWQRRLWLYDENVVGPCDGENPMPIDAFQPNQYSTNLLQYINYPPFSWNSSPAKLNTNSVYIRCQ